MQKKEISSMHFCVQGLQKHVHSIEFERIEIENQSVVSQFCLSKEVSILEN